jgi:hypothetical protein
VRFALSNITHLWLAFGRAVAELQRARAVLYRKSRDEFATNITLRGSCCQKNATAQQVKAGMAEHLAFDHLETIDLSFGLSIAPGGCESGIYRAAISSQSGGKCLDDGHAGGTGLGKPGSQISRSRTDVCLLAGVASADECGEAARQFCDDGSVVVLLDPGDGCSIGGCQHGMRLHE